MTQQRQRVHYGTTVIEYDITYARRKTMAISVQPDLSVIVTAPADTDRDMIAARVRRRAPWIVRQQRELSQYPPATPPRVYVSGETHRYLGRQYRLKVIADRHEAVKLLRGFLYTWTPDKYDAARVQHLVDGWYHRQAERVFHERLQALVPRLQHIDITTPRLIIKRLQTRWGSCTSDGLITLNLKLMQVPKHYIDYVIVHELCHLVEHNHSKRFYQLLDRTMPDWRTRRQHLNMQEVV